VSGETLRQATESDVGGIVELLMRVFGTGGRWTPEAFHTFYDVDCSYAPEQSLLIECEGALASHVRCSRRTMRVRFSLCLVRPERWWQDRYAWSWDRETDRFFVAEREGKVGAYLRALTWRGEVAVMDAAPADTEEQALTAMLHQVVSCCPEARTVSGPVPLGTPLDRAIRNLPGETQKWESNDMMLRLMDVRELFRSLLPELNRRCASLLSDAMRGEVAVDMPGGSLALRVTHSVQLVEPTAEALPLALTDREALLLVLGYTGVERLPFARDRQLAGDAVATLSHLFPRRPQVFWAMDQF